MTIARNLAIQYEDLGLRVKLITLAKSFFSMQANIDAGVGRASPDHNTLETHAFMALVACVLSHTSIPNITMHKLECCKLIQNSVLALSGRGVLIEFQSMPKIIGFVFQSKEIIGSGHTGLVRKVKDLYTQSEHALKLPCTTIFDRCSPIERLKGELVILDYLFSKIRERSLIGIPINPVELESLSGEPAILMPLQTDYYKYLRSINYNIEIAVEIFHLLQVICGAWHLSQQGIIHSDIKLENVLCAQKESLGGLYEMRLTDVDNVYCQTITDRQPSLSFNPGATPAQERVFLGYRGGSISKREIGLNKLMIFQLGILVYQALNGNQPFIDSNFQARSQISRKLPGAISACLDRMLSTNSENRPQIEEVYSVFYGTLKQLSKHYISLFESLGEIPTFSKSREDASAAACF